MNARLSGPCAIPPRPATGGIGANARVQIGKNQTWIEAVNTLPESNALKQQFEEILEEISQDNTLNEDEKSISKEKTEA
jgi:hypothetical protein